MYKRYYKKVVQCAILGRGGASQRRVDCPPFSPKLCDFENKMKTYLFWYETQENKHLIFGKYNIFCECRLAISV